MRDKWPLISPIKSSAFKENPLRTNVIMALLCGIGFCIMAAFKCLSEKKKDETNHRTLSITQ